MSNYSISEKRSYPINKWHRDKYDLFSLLPRVSEELIKVIREDYGTHTPCGLGRNHKNYSMKMLSKK